MSATLEIIFGGAPNQDSFKLKSSFTLSSTASNGIHPHAEPVTLQIGTFTTTIPPGSFKKHEHEDEDEGEGEHEDRFFSFHGVIDGVRLKAVIKRTGTLRYVFLAKAKGADLTGTKNPVYVTLIIGGDSGATSVTAVISPLKRALPGVIRSIWIGSRAKARQPISRRRLANRSCRLPHTRAPAPPSHRRRYW